MKRYQADIDVGQTYTGQVYEERGRTFLALRGQAAYEPAPGKPGAIGSLGDAAELKNTINNNNWNDLGSMTIRPAAAWMVRSESSSTSRIRDEDRSAEHPNQDLLSTVVRVARLVICF